METQQKEYTESLIALDFPELNNCNLSAILRSVEFQNLFSKSPTVQVAERFPFKCHWEAPLGTSVYCRVRREDEQQAGGSSESPNNENDEAAALDDINNNLIKRTVVPITHADGRRYVKHLDTIGCSTSRVICEIADGDSASGKALQRGLIDLPDEV